jgi:peptidoglycan/LPS O-acetylase OafA/YrhL
VKQASRFAHLVQRLRPSDAPRAQESNTPIGSPPEARRHLPALDGLRGLAILLVMLYHFTGGVNTAAYGLDRWLSRITGCGWCGVDLFFVLSGFLITGILCDSKASPTYFRDFYARRSLRIFPLYYGVLMVLFLIFPLFPSLNIPGLQSVGEHQSWLWTYTTNIAISLHGNARFRSEFIQTGHFWSLAVEEQFYLVWPMVVLVLGRRALARLCMALFAISLLLRCALTAGGIVEVSTLTPCRLDGLMVGALIALHARSGNNLATLVPSARRIAAYTGAALIAISVWAGLDLLHWLTRAVGFSLLAVFFGAVLVLTLGSSPSSRFPRFFNNRVLQFFGRYSYGLYVWHFLLAPTFGHYFSVNILIDRVFGHYWPARICYVFFCFTASIAVAWVSWHLFEKHFLRLKRFFEHERGGQVATSRQGQYLTMQASTGASPT